MDGEVLALWPVILGWMLCAVLAATAVWALLSAIKQHRKWRFVEYGWETKAFQLEDDGAVQYAQWLHPKEGPKEVTQEQVNVLRRFIREGDLVIDIGAHSGDTTVPLALAAGKSGCTLALEPNPFVFKILAQNAALNRDKTNITPLCIAATETDGAFTFHYSDGAYCNGGFLDKIRDKKHGHLQPLEVQGRNLEKLLRREYADRLERLSYVKIDTEGYDAFVIQSLRKLLREYQPVVVCEVLGRLDQQERETLYDALADCGYQCHKYDAAGCEQGQPIERGDMTAWRHFDILALPAAGENRAAA